MSLYVLFVVVCPEKENMQLKVSLRQSTRARKANHNTSSMLFTAYVICAQVTHTACVWFAWERGMRRRLSRFALLPKGPLLQGGFLQKRFPWRRSRFHWRQRSWGSQRDLMEGSETSESLSPSSPVRSDDRSPRLEARQADTSPRAAAAAFLLSSSEEVDKGNAGQIAPLSFAPVWGAGGGDHSCCCQAKFRLAGREFYRTAGNSGCHQSSGSGGLLGGGERQISGFAEFSYILRIKSHTLIYLFEQVSLVRMQRCWKMLLPMINLVADRWIIKGIIRCHLFCQHQTCPLSLASCPGWCQCAR